MIETISPWINQTAAVYRRSYGTWTSFPDIRQHLMAWAYENARRIEGYLAQEDGERIVRSVLNMEARKYCIKERAVSSGYSPEDVAWYSVTALKNRLPDVFDYRDWQSFQAGEGGPRSNKPAAWSGDRLAELIDVSKAYDSLTPTSKLILREHFGNGLSVQQCADVLGIPYDTAQKRIVRALSALSRQLNNPRPKDPMEGATLEEWRANQAFYDTRSKGRHAISNAAARKMTD